MEKIRGDYKQRAIAGSYLNQLREKLPLDEFSKKTMNTRFDIWLQQSRSKVRINVDLFKNIIEETASQIQRYDQSFQVLPFDRYVIGEVNALTDTDTGGFNSKYSRGFKYLANCGYAAVLSERYTTNQQVTTQELARSYLHDSIHSSSFRTIRVLPEGIESKFPVYREQYGINFRRANGSSYSTSQSYPPEHINLGVLMDGVTVLMTAEFLSRYTSLLSKKGLNNFEQVIVADISLDLDRLPNWYRGKGFHQNVTIPTQSFITYWGRDDLYRHLIRSMLTGKMKDLVRFFDTRIGKVNSWPRLIKADTY